MHEKSAYRLMAYLFFIHSTMTIIVGYIPVYFQAEGLSSSQVGLLMAIGPLATIIAQPFWGYMSDKYKSIKRMLLVAIVGVIVSAMMFLFIDSFLGFMVLMFVLFLFISPTTALGDSLAQQTAYSQRISFGRIRMWGSLGFGITSLLTGYLLSIVGVENIMYPMLTMAIVSFFFALNIQDAPQTNKPVTVIDAFKLSMNPALLFFLGCVLFISVTHRANDTYLGLYIVELGGPEAMIGWAWFIGVSTEAIVFATSAYWFRKWSPLTFVIIAGFIYVCRWFMLSLLSEPWILLPLQALHGVTFGLLYLTAFQFVNFLIPKHLQATGHVLFITIVFGLSGIIGSLLGGYLIDITSMNQLYFFMSISALFGTGSLIIFKRFYDARVEIKKEAVS
ncbi:MFS transporter [Alkalihalobacillus hemicellulosilyticus]|uniref:Permeases of the major facilitator superfamily n=1 Tax=Halalkalibacter hemicellulosilyticusJCM 9152 TaxID=1236971 RepID=W4QFN5_9BACI|nr:MFS transporter [Halalkalibacter hemicellulosilyticus]GAE30905.1 permeases of the major facilitator superfamily [Halalkalibacter hemicellulosilyticusJCM 9152]